MLLPLTESITDTVPGVLAESGTGAFYVVFIRRTASVVHEFELPNIARAEFAHHQVKPQTDALLQAELAIQSF